jgi:hypothetical protein
LKDRILDLPLGGFCGSFVSFPVGDSSRRTVEQDDGIGGRFAGLFLGAESARLDAWWLSTIHVVNGPSMGRIGWVAVKRTIGETEGRKRQKTESQQADGLKKGEFHKLAVMEDRVPKKSPCLGHKQGDVKTC